MVRAQISMEFITGITVMLVIYVLAVGAYSYYTENNIIEDVFAEHICYGISEGVDSAVIGGNGFSINMTIPYRIYNDDITGVLVTTNHTLTVDWESGIAACSIITNNITDIWMYSGGVSATNIDETIYVTSIWTDKSYYDESDLVYINSSHILGSTAKIEITDESGSAVYTNSSVPVSSNIAKDIWDTSGQSSEQYTVSIIDNDYKNLNAQKEIRIV
jgi:hypothetical protein